MLTANIRAVVLLMGGAMNESHPPSFPMFQEETDCTEHCKVGTAYFEIMEQNNHPSLGLSRLSYFFILEK